MLILVSLVVIGKVCVSSKLIYKFLIRLKKDYFKPNLILDNREPGMAKT